MHRVRASGPDGGWRGFARHGSGHQRQRFGFHNQLLALGGFDLALLGQRRQHTCQHFVEGLVELAFFLAVDGAEIVASSPEEFATFLRNETVKWAAVVKAAGIPQE